ncbi:hypothetical protein [Variovorax sp. PBL-E5]|uniref:hypothetical protein n=1 Tax=Variovorax sp. PBL-E5 TaxID=434014 RepID=UPI0013A5B103|nr:hypothetical protein [Variovorax sp. PBL-E5]
MKRQVRRDTPTVQHRDAGYDGFGQWLRALRDWPMAQGAFWARKNTVDHPARSTH